MRIHGLELADSVLHCHAMLRQVPVQLLMQEGREQFVVGTEEVHVEREHRESVVHGPLLDDYLAGEGVLADIVLLEQLLEFQFLLLLARGVVASLDFDCFRGEGCDCEKEQ
jgi:hypothetical protein